MTGSDAVGALFVCALIAMLFLVGGVVCGMVPLSGVPLP